MICERCGHEGCAGGFLYAENCIANLRADLAQSRKMELDAETRACAAEEQAHPRMAIILRLEKDLEAERARSWEGWQQSEHYERLSFDLITGAIPSYAERIDHEKFGRREAEERAARAEARVQEVRERLCENHRILLWDPNCPYCALASEHERAARAEAQCAAMRAVLQAFTGHWHGYEEREDPRGRGILDQARDVLDVDAGRDLLTAVRRLCEAARAFADGNVVVHDDWQRLRAAVADPALAALRGAP